MKIALSQQNYILGDFAYNLEKIKTSIDKAIASQADLIVFSELAICGYPPTDFFDIDDFIEKCNQAVDELLPFSHQIGILIGSPTKNKKPEGKDLFNSAIMLHQGQRVATVHKTLLPTYDIFDEYRYFEPNKTFECVSFKGKKIAITICEDIWNIGNENPMYEISPMDELVKQAPDFMINLSASPFSFSHSDERKQIVKENCLRYQIPIFYCNSVGAQTEIIFDGGSLVCDKLGNPIVEMSYFEEDFAVVDSQSLGLEKEIQPFKDKNERIYKALVMGIRDYFAKSGFKKAVLGLSGGIDSALTCVLAADALGSQNVLSVLMPSEFSTSHSVEDALNLCKNLNSPYEILEIKENFDSILGNLKPIFGNRPFDVAEENLQARIRGMLLMAVSNKFGNILLNTSNKSEMAVGYGTLYGDMCGGIAVLGDVYKTEVYDLSRYINRLTEIIPINSIEKAPSAELRPGQKDQDSLPPYEILDAVLFQYIEKKKSPMDIVAMGFEEALVRRIVNMVNRNEFKRFQAAPILRVSSKAFGYGRRIPIVAKYL
jgi:NAD+ synthase (glutamine-hydrolysing)